MIHKLSEVQTVHIGANTFVWQFTVILKGAVIGDNCNINCHVFIENDVLVGNNVTVKSGVYLWDGITIEDNVHIGPNVTFVNDKYHRSKVYPEAFQKTIVRHHASLGAASTLLGGLEIGEYSLIGAGSVVTKDVPARALFFGNPAKQMGWVNEDGSRMRQQGNFFIDNKGERWQVNKDTLEKL
ncbi:MAG: acyltransferase [Bacteroidota bacterium]